MTPILLISAAGLAAGVALLLGELRWFARVSLADRLRTYASGGLVPTGRAPAAETLRELLEPLARRVGERLARALGVGEELTLRLERLHSPLDPTAFRLRQVGWGVAAFGIGSVLALGLRLPPVVGVLFPLGAPLLAFLLLEQRLASASAAWQGRVERELPVVTEQIAMLLGAGYSVGAALARIAARGSGACARDLARVCGRTRQGLSEADALREWAAVARVPAVDRIVAVLALGREAPDLGRLLTEEARAVRRDVHRHLLDSIERRTQQVWIPVTVATLIPGVLFLAVPFLRALSLFAG